MKTHLNRGLALLIVLAMLLTLLPAAVSAQPPIPEEESPIQPPHKDAGTLPPHKDAGTPLLTLCGMTLASVTLVEASAVRREPVDTTPTSPLFQSAQLQRISVQSW